MRVFERIDKILSSSWALWLISVVSAVALWFYVTRTEESEHVTRRFSCPLEYRALDAQAMLRGRVSEVDVEIRGLEGDVERLDYDAITCYVDARNLSPGKRYSQNVRVTLPPNITLVSCIPSQVVLDLVRQVVRLIPVEVVLPQDIPEGYYLEGVEVIPKEVGVRGTEGDVAKIGALRVAPTVEELQKGKELLLPVKFAQSEPFDNSVSLELSQVRVRGALARGLPRRRVPVNARLSGQPAPDYEVRSVVADPLEVQLEGPVELLNKITEVDTETVDISLLSADQTLVVPLKQPDGLVLGMQSVSLALHLSRRSASKQLANVPVNIREGQGGRWRVEPATVTVTLEGPASRVEGISQETVGLRAWVDLSNIFVTPVTLPVRTELASAEFAVSGIAPATVKLTAGLAQE